MKFTLAPDSFKESMSAQCAVMAMERGIRRVFPGAECIGVPMADGGEGTVEALVAAMGGTEVTVPVQDGLGRLVGARYGYVDCEKLAIIEMAAAAGLGLVDKSLRDPRVTGTFGVGQMIGDALDRGARHFIIGLGGSVSNDGGAGMLQALGVRFIDAAGDELPSGGAALARLDRIDISSLDRRLGEVEFRIVSDVSNPLLGPEGASAVFGPQKGADERTVRELEDALATYARVVTAATGRDIANVAGAGAAGGVGAALLAFFDVDMRRGMDIVMEAARLEEKIEGADFVFTGEGSLDEQTICGKTPFGVAQAAGRQGVPVIAFAGRVGPGSEVLYEHGFRALVPIIQSVSDLPSALADGPRNLERAVSTTCRLLGIGH